MTDPSSDPDFPDWLGKLIAIIALGILLMAVFAVVGELLPRLLGM